MNIRQQTHTKMFIAVLGVLDNFKTVWQATIAFANTRAALAAAIEAIRAEELKQAGTTRGISQNKRIARQTLCVSAAIVGGAVAAYAEQQGKHDLFDTVDFSAADLLHQTESDCLTHCTAIYNAGTANLAALTADGTLTDAELNDLNVKISAFNTLLTQPRQVKAGTKAATDLLPEKIDAGDRLCERQLDRLMERYQSSNPDFYGAYQVARIIVDAGGSNGNGDTPTTTSTATAQPATATAVK